MRQIAAGALLLLSGYVQADFQCQVTLRDDIRVTPDYVEVTRTGDTLKITPQGDVLRNGQPVTLNAQQRQLAQNYQQEVRHDLPWIKTETERQLDAGKQALDAVVVDKLGQNSRVRQRLVTLNQGMKAQLGRVIEQPAPQQLVFHHQAVTQLRQSSQQLLQQALGGMLQDSLNESSTMAVGKGENPLQALMGMQQSLKQTLKAQENNFKTLGRTICQRAERMENQRAALVKALPAK